MKICFATLAFGGQYRFHAQRLCLDLAEFAPHASVFVLTDRPSEFTPRDNLTIGRYHPEGILRRYHDKRLLIGQGLDRYDYCIVIDANSRICEPLPPVLDIPPGISAFMAQPLEEHLLAETKNPKRKKSGLGSVEYERRIIEKAARELGVKLEEVRVIQESVYAVRGEPARIREFIECWGRIGRFFDYHGMAWSEGFGIGLAAAKCGIPIQEHPFLPLVSFYKHRLHGSLIEKGQLTHKPTIRVHNDLQLINQFANFSALPKPLSNRLEKCEMGCRWLLARARGEPSLRGAERSQGARIETVEL